MQDYDLQLLKYSCKFKVHYKPYWQWFIENIITNKRFKSSEWLWIHHMSLNRHGDWLYEKQCIAISLKIIIWPMRKYYLKSYIMPHMAYTFPFSINLKEMKIFWIYLTSSLGTYMFWWCV